MAKIWHSIDGEAEEPGGWDQIPVPDAERYVLVEIQSGSSRPRVAVRQRLRPASLKKTGSVQFLLVRTGTARTERWFAVLFPAVSMMVNGNAVCTGLTMLADKDVISFASGQPEWVFTTERNACVEFYQGEPGLHCPRCKLPLEPGQPMVVCPGCSAVHHQLEHRSCWTYAPTCALCDRATPLEEATCSWTPNEL